MEWPCQAFPFSGLRFSGGVCSLRYCFQVPADSVAHSEPQARCSWCLRSEVYSLSEDTSVLSSEMFSDTVVPELDDEAAMSEDSELIESDDSGVCHRSWVVVRFANNFSGELCGQC